MRRFAAASFVCLLLTGCPPQAEQANHSEAGSPGVVASEPSESDAVAIVDAASGNTLAFEGGRVEVPFPYVITYDRIEETENYAEQRQVFMEVIGLEVGGIADALQQAMAEGGFSSEYVRADEGVVRAKFSKEGVHSVFALIRPAGVGPKIHEEGATASLFLTQALKSK